MSTVEQDYDTIASVCNQFNATSPLVCANPAQLKQDIFGDSTVPDDVMTPKGVNGTPASIALVSTSKAVSMSEQDINDPSNIQDYYMLTHELQLTPNIAPYGLWTGVGSYLVEVVPIDGNGALAYPNAKALTPKSQPDTTESLTNYSESLSQSVSGNIGFFGPTPTGGVSGGLSTSHSISYQTADVSVTNKPNGSAVSILFSIAPGAAVATAGFQPTVQHLNSSPDSVHFLPKARSNQPADAGTAPCVWFLLKVTTSLRFQVKFDGGIWGSSAKVGLAPMAEFQIPIQVRMPPLPPNVSS